MSGRGWRPFSSREDGLAWFLRNCSHCRHLIVSGRLPAPEEGCVEQKIAINLWVRGQALPIGFFEVVFKRKPLRGDLEWAWIIPRCRSRVYTGGRPIIRLKK
jgi:hypothetical protein